MGKNKLSRYIRWRYGLPIKGPTGLDPAARIKLIKLYYLENLLRGKEAEDRFFAAWRVCKRLPHPIVRVMRATPHEDAHEKTDAVILTKRSRIRFQIKSYRTNQQVFEKFCSMGIVLISVLPNITYKQIRHRTMVQWNRFKAYNQQKYAAKINPKKAA